MSSAGGDRLDSIERGLDALFATEVASEILDAVDFEAILADEPAEDPVDVERLADAVGRVLAHRVIGGSGATGFAKRTVGSRMGGRIAAETVRYAAENIDPNEVAEALVEIDEGTPGPQLRRIVDPVVDNLAVPVYEIVDVPVEDGTVEQDPTETRDGIGDDGSGGAGRRTDPGDGDTGDGDFDGGTGRDGPAGE